MPPFVKMGAFFLGLCDFFRLGSQYLTTVSPIMFLKNVRYAFLDVMDSGNKNHIAY